MTGAQAINETFRYGGRAGRTTTIVNDALLGLHPHDLSGLIRGQRDLFTKLASTDGALSDLISNFNTTAGALAWESANLSASIRELAPTLQEAEPSLRHLNDALPPFRALARESLPGIRQLPATISAGSPWLVQTDRLLRQNELGGTAQSLAASAPGLAKAGHASLKLFPQVGLFSRCVSHNLVPAGNTVIDDAGGTYPFSTGQPNFREFFYSVVQLAGESQGFDCNGPFVRFQAGGGTQLVRMPTTATGFGEKSIWLATSRRLSRRARGFRPAVSRPSAWTFPATAGGARPQRPCRRRRPPEPGGRSVRRAIREHLRDFVAIGVLIVVGLVTTGVILASQTTLIPSWIPLGEDRFELKAEFSSAQAVTPGQGQTVTIAGINVGQVSRSELESGRAVVTMQVDNKYASLIHPDASLLLRPRTGLQDMTIEVDPGTGDQEVNEGSTLPLANSQPNVQLDQILASLDGDTRSFLQLLLQAASEGLHNNGRKLAAGLKRFEPFARDLARINGALAQRRQNIKRVITNFGLLSQELGRRDTELAGFVRSPTMSASFARQQSSLRATLRELPGTLNETHRALVSGDRFARQLGPGSRALIPAAQGLAPALRETRPLFRNTVGPIRDQIRPFARDVQKPLRQLKPLGKPLATLDRACQELRRAQPVLQFARLQPPRLCARGLSFLALLAESQHQRALLHSGRRRAAAARLGAPELRHIRRR